MGRLTLSFSYNEHRNAIDVQDLRHTGDYGQFQALNYQQAQQQITHAELFLTIAKTNII